MRHFPCYLLQRRSRTKYCVCNPTDSRYNYRSTYCDWGKPLTTKSTSERTTILKIQKSSTTLVELFFVLFFYFIRIMPYIRVSIKNTSSFTSIVFERRTSFVCIDCTRSVGLPSTRVIITRFPLFKYTCGA